jgi:hypothetical protein
VEWGGEDRSELECTVRAGAEEQRAITGIIDTPKLNPVAAITQKLVIVLFVVAELDTRVVREATATRVPFPPPATWPCRDYIVVSDVLAAFAECGGGDVGAHRKCCICVHVCGCR